MTDLSSREKPRNLIAKQGSMNLMSDKPYWWVIPLVIILALGVAACIAIIAFDNAFTLLGIFACFIICLPGDFMFLLARTGKACRYEADEEKLTVFRRDKTEEYYYREIICVKFEPFSMILGMEVFNCGYKVTIETKYNTTVRYYAFNGAHGKNPPQETPFWILVMNMPEGKNEETNEIITGEEYHANAKKKEP
ncbi:MAG: hypothetical protein ACI4JS_10305 [Oscillospiraceae bacterium]